MSKVSDEEEQLLPQTGPLPVYNSLIWPERYKYTTEIKEVPVVVHGRPKKLLESQAAETPKSTAEKPSDKVSTSRREDDSVFQTSSTLLSSWLSGLTKEDQLSGLFGELNSQAYQKRKENLLKYSGQSRMEPYSHLKLTVVDSETLTQLTTLMSETVRVKLTSERLTQALSNLNYS